MLFQDGVPPRPSLVGHDGLRRSPGNPGGRGRGPGGARAARASALLALLALATGCARGGLPLDPNGAPQAVAPEAAAAPQDPLLAFAAQAAPGASGVVGGQRVRVQRAYVAASGRECRELLIGTGAAERSSLVCRDGAGWARARPLLRAGGGGGGVVLGAMRP